MIKIESALHKTFSQKFSFFNEETWQQQKIHYPESLQLIFEGKRKQIYTLADQEGLHFLIGLGKADIQNYELQDMAILFAYAERKSFQTTTTKINADFLNESQFASLIEGLFLGTYSYGLKLEHAFWQPGFVLQSSNFSAEVLKEIGRKAQALCNGQFACMEWLNKPANYKSAAVLSAYLKNLAQEKRLKYTVYNRKECREIGLGAYLSVNQGSAQDAAFTILEYTPQVKPAESLKTVGLVGKCVLFDTGGISLKDGQNMHYMKSDMGGATAVIGTLIAAAELQLPVKIVAILPITDNAISKEALLPSDVVTAYNGKTIEVLNTDAEGRMILADGLSYLSKNYSTDVMLDLATLTGSAVRMFGDTCAALMGNNTDLIQTLLKSSEETNQRLWNLPLWDVWKEDITSDVADLKNISLKPIGDCIVAGKFLEQFIEGHQNWAHLDVAGVAFGNVHYAKEKAATGYGVQLLLNFLKNFV